MAHYESISKTSNNSNANLELLYAVNQISYTFLKFTAFVAFIILLSSWYNDPSDLRENIKKELLHVEFENLHEGDSFSANLSEFDLRLVGEKSMNSITALYINNEEEIDGDDKIKRRVFY